MKATDGDVGSVLLDELVVVVAQHGGGGEGGAGRPADSLQDLATTGGR